MLASWPVIIGIARRNVPRASAVQLGRIRVGMAVATSTGGRTKARHRPTAKNIVRFRREICRVTVASRSDPRHHRPSPKMPDRAYTQPIDPELLPGARNAIRVCLRLQPNERMTIITDEASREIAAALQREVEAVGADYSLFVLERHARRPLEHMPENILDDLARSQVSVFCALTQTG